MMEYNTAKQQIDVITTITNPNWNKASSNWMVVAGITLVYAVFDPSTLFLYVFGGVALLLSGMAYRLSKKGGN